MNADKVENSRRGTGTRVLFMALFLGAISSACNNAMSPEDGSRGDSDRSDNSASSGMVRGRGGGGDSEKTKLAVNAPAADGTGHAGDVFGSLTCVGGLDSAPLPEQTSIQLVLCSDLEGLIPDRRYSVTKELRIDRNGWEPGKTRYMWSVLDIPFGEYAYLTVPSSFHGRFRVAHNRETLDLSVRGSLAEVSIEVIGSDSGDSVKPDHAEFRPHVTAVHSMWIPGTTLQYDAAAGVYSAYTYSEKIELEVVASGFEIFREELMLPISDLPFTVPLERAPRVEISASRSDGYQLAADEFEVEVRTPPPLGRLKSVRSGHSSKVFYFSTPGMVEFAVRRVGSDHWEELELNAPSAGILRHTASLD